MMNSLLEVALVLLVLLGGSMGVPMGLPPGPEDPVMSKIAPDDCVFYASWSGVVEIDPTANPTEKWMSQPTISAALIKIRKAYRGMLLQRGENNEDPLFQHATRLAVEIVEAASTEPAGFYLDRFEIEKNELDLRGAAVISLGDRADPAIQQFQRLLREIPLRKKPADVRSLLEVVEMVGKPSIKIEIPKFKFPVYAAIWGKYFVVGLGDGSLAKLAADWETPQPKWLADMRQRLKMDRVASLGYIDAPNVSRQVFASPDFNNFFATKALKELSEEVQSVGWVSGLDANGFLTRTDIQIPDNKTRITSIFDGDPIPKQFLTDFPADPMAGFATRISTKKILEFAKSNARDVGQKQALENSLQEFQKLTGVKLEEELLDAVGNFIYVYYNFDMASPEGGWLVSVRIEDEMSFPAIFEELNKGLKNWIQQQPGMKFTVEKIGQYEIFSITHDQESWKNFAWSLIDEQWYFARSPREIVKHVQGQPEENQLVNHAAIKEMFEFGHKEGFGNPVGIASLNLPPIVKFIHPFLMQWNNQPNQNISPDLDFTVGDIPSLNELVNEVQPNFSAVYRTETGFQIFQRQTYPGASPPVSIFAIAAGSLPYAVAVFKSLR